MSSVPRPEDGRRLLEEDVACGNWPVATIATAAFSSARVDGTTIRRVGIDWQHAKRLKSDFRRLSPGNRWTKSRENRRVDESDRAKENVRMWWPMMAL